MGLSPSGKIPGRLSPPYGQIPGRCFPLGEIPERKGKKGKKRKKGKKGKKGKIGKKGKKGNKGKKGKEGKEGNKGKIGKKGKKGKIAKKGRKERRERKERENLGVSVGRWSPLGYGGGCVWVFSFFSNLDTGKVEKLLTRMLYGTIKNIFFKLLFYFPG